MNTEYKRPNTEQMRAGKKRRRRGGKKHRGAAQTVQPEAQPDGTIVLEGAGDDEADNGSGVVVIQHGPDKNDKAVMVTLRLRGRDLDRLRQFNMTDAELDQWATRLVKSELARLKHIDEQKAAKDYVEKFQPAL